MAVLVGVVLLLAVTATGAMGLLQEDPVPKAEDPRQEAPGSTAAPSPTTAVPEDGPPVALPADGAYARVTVLRSGELDVRHWIKSTSPLTGIRLATPSDAFSGDGVTAYDLRVAADGAAIDSPDGLGAAPVAISFPEAHTLELTYRLSGAVVPSPSHPRRALARVVSLDLGYGPRGGPAIFGFRGARALNLVCTEGTATQPPVPCGRRGANGDWDVASDELDGDYRVMALLEWPPPTSG